MSKDKKMKTKLINKIQPWAITGLIDAEGSLGVIVTKDITLKTGYNITLFL